VALALKNKLRQVAQNQEKDNQQENDVEIDQREYDDIGIDRKLNVALEQLSLEPNEKRYQGDAEDNNADDQFSFLTPLLDGWNRTQRHEIGC
jgi:hypothetical protein